MHTDVMRVLDVKTLKVIKKDLLALQALMEETLNEDSTLEAQELHKRVVHEIGWVTTLIYSKE